LQGIFFRGTLLPLNFLLENSGSNERLNGKKIKKKKRKATFP